MYDRDEHYWGWGGARWAVRSRRHRRRRVRRPPGPAWRTPM